VVSPKRYGGQFAVALILFCSACSVSRAQHNSALFAARTATPALSAAMGGATGALATSTVSPSRTPLVAGPPPASDATLAVQHSPQVEAALAALAPRLDAEREQRGVAGMSVGVVYDQTLIWSRGFGSSNVETQEPATPDTLYRVGSITKLFTDTMLMQLRDAGKLNLDDPVANYLPDFPVSDPYSSPGPTFRQLASHTSGLPREAPINYWRTREFPTEPELLESLQHTELLSAPGTVYRYSNLGVAIEGMALERVAGEPYERYVEERILSPLGMTASGFELTDAVRARLASGTPAASTPEGADRLPDFGALTPAAGLYTSVDDIARFMALQFRDGNADTSPVLDGPSLQEMHSAASRGKAPGDFALGWELGNIGGSSTIGHPGVVYGFTTQITLAPAAKLGVAVFTNGRTDPGAMANEMLAALLPPVLEAAGG